MITPEATTTEEEGARGVYDCYCLKCSFRYVGVAPVQAEDIDLWLCDKCQEMTVTWHPHPDAEEDER